MISLADAPGAAPFVPDAVPKHAHVFRTGNRCLKVFAPDDAPKRPSSQAIGPTDHRYTRAVHQQARQAEVAKCMAQGPYRVPPILKADLENGVLEMPWIGGASLADVILKGDPCSVAKRAGEWLATHHALSQRKWPFQPRGHVNWLNRLIEESVTGMRTIPDSAAFSASARATQEKAWAARGQKGRKAITHRDMTLANLIWDGDVVWGIDFENAREDEPLRDLFTLALDILTLVPDRYDTSSVLIALKQAYGDGHTAPAVRHALQDCFCLWVWANTPLAPSRRQRARWSIARDLLTSDHLVL